MKKLYLILMFFVLIIGASKAAPIKDSLNYLQARELGGCDPPIINADSLLLEYFTGQPLSAVGGVPPYTYTFSPAITSSELISPPDSAITYTITVTGANGCDSTYHAHYVPLPPGTTGACDAIFISDYIQDTVNHDDAIELYNPTGSSISLTNYYLFGTTNGSLLSTPFYIALHGTIGAYQTFLIANTFADTSLTHKAKMLSDSLNFGGKDIVTLAKAVISPPNITFAFLDEIGTVYPLPTDSGWAVGSGSTKNHTLVRKVSVTQGDLNWSTCKSEWNVYARGTYSYIGHYTNTCHIDPELVLYVANGTTTCGDPSYYEFSIMASSVPKQSIFNNCLLEIQYTGAEFLGDSYFHNTILVSAGPNFGDYSHALGFNDVSDSTLSIGMGVPGDSLVDGTILDSVPQELLHIKLEIQNSCASGKVLLTDTSWDKYFADYAEIDSVGRADSAITGYTTCCVYQCGDSSGPVYNCNPYCCDTDIYGNCDSICYWDTCTIYPVYCYDTTWTYTADSVYHFVSYANLVYTNEIYSPYDSLLTGSSGCAPAISDFTAPINAGVDDVLTITGANFGNTRGTNQVKFYDADTSNYHIQHLNAIDYISWSNTQIKIRLPAFADSIFASGLSKQLGIGGGNFIVTTSCGDSVMSGNNSNGDPFSVYYNIQQSWNTLFTPHTKRELLLRNTDTNGGYVLRFDSVTFPKGSIQRLIFTRAMRDWTCYTGMNWIVGKDTNIAFSGHYRGVNYVFFSDSLLSSGTVAETFIQPDECADSIDIIKGAVTCFNSTKNFIYDTTGTANIPANHCDFYGVCLHELGHFIEIGHSTDQSSLMYWTANNGPISPSNRITLGAPTAAAAVDGGIYSVSHSVSISDMCDGFSAMQGENTACVNETSVNKVQKSNINFSVYPNPSHGTFIVQSNISSYTLVVLNMLGQRIFEQKVNGKKIVISLSTQPNGMYFVQEQYTSGIATQKLIISK